VVRLPFGLFRDATITRRSLFLFTLASAILNGLVTASVGAWLARKFSETQTQRQSINAISGLYYERRIKAGMVVSSMRRVAELDEIRHRKRSYDEAFVDWNKNIRQNLFAIREVLGNREMTDFEEDFQTLLVKPLSDLDRCLTTAYDAKIAGQDPLPTLDACKWPIVYQLTLDCGSAYTDELYKMTRVSFNPFQSRMSASERSEMRQRVNTTCATAPRP
jgi:hypothetical protein